MIWTADAVALTKCLWDKGMSAAQIADALGEGASRNAVIGKLHRLGIKRGLGAVVLNYWIKPEKPNPFVKPKVLRAPNVVHNAEKLRDLRANASPELVVVDLNLTWAPLRVPILDLDKNQCRNSVGLEDGLFCGLPTIPGKPWCPRCNALLYRSKSARAPAVYLAEPIR
jgi:GcrA cell cycle regulator